jgi:hypothetical protein
VKATGSRPPTIIKTVTAADIGRETRGRRRMVVHNPRPSD